MKVDIEELNKRLGISWFERPVTEDEWRALFAKTDSMHEKMYLILSNTDGYGIEYGYDQDDDAEYLAMAFAALQPKVFP